MGEITIELAKVAEMLDLLDVPNENSNETDSPHPRKRNTNKNNKTAADKAKIDTMANVIKSLVRVVTELADKVAAQESIAVEVSGKDNIIEELQSKIAALEQKSQSEKDVLENRIKESETVIEGLQNRHNDESNEKLKEVEKECDEARQREMKGTLIVSSPERGNIHTEAVKRGMYWPQTNTWGPESDMDMVLRLVYEKHGVRIPYNDVSACHRFGKYENHTFVLKIWNRKPFSAWDMLSKAMLSGKDTSRLNIFVNFMLTARRTELSKMVRQAKKDKYITKYSVDQNGKIFVVKTGENSFTEVKSASDIDILRQIS